MAYSLEKYLVSIMSSIQETKPFQNEMALFP